MRTDQQLQDEKFMQRALQLAGLGRGSVSPNPMVGCVIVHGDMIIGEGWHRKYGGPHAEVNAIAEVANKDLLQQSTVYVSLEPCSHFGKTPPCADLLIKYRVRRVVVANVDPNPIVAGNGIARLRAAGIDVTEGIFRAEGRDLNRRFFVFMEQKRPYIILKWAQTSDGFIARENFDSKWISNAYSRMLVHRWRSEEDGIMVGTRTALQDDPQLNVRDWSGRNPVRIVVDRSLKLPANLKVFDGSSTTICYNLKKNQMSSGVEFVKLPIENFIEEMLKDLYQRKIQSLIVEGGTQLLHAFLDARCWDEARVFYSSAMFGKGIAAPKMDGKPVQHQSIGGDTLRIYQP